MEMEKALEKIIQKGWIVLIDKNQSEWVVQLKEAETGKLVTELRHNDLEELLDELSYYHSA